MFSYHHEYNKCLVYKVFCAEKPDRVITDFEQTLEIIRKVHFMTGGIRQIVYLIGWQYDGHDSKYPAWFEVNKRLRRRGDDTAKASLQWLMAEAQHYNTVVSLHIDMCIAFTDSPLWDEYVANDLLVKNPDGSYMDVGILWGGEQSFAVSKTLDFQKGFAQKRISRLLELLPELRNAATIHIDVFMPIPSPFHKITRDDEFESMKAILACWNSYGIDVTTEWFHFELAGYVPMAWHFNLGEASRLEYPSSLICGGGKCWNTSSVRPRYPGMAGLNFARPEEGCLYEEAWGYSMDQDFTPGFEKYFRQNFYLSTLPWTYLNTKTILKHVQTKSNYSVEFGDGITSDVETDNQHFTIKTGDRILVDGTDVFIPAVWTDTSWIMYSHDGGHKRWPVPEQWQGLNRLKFKDLSAYPEDRITYIDCASGYLEMEIKPLQAFMVSAR